jgi:hypothetical protein
MIRFLRISLVLLSTLIIIIFNILGINNFYVLSTDLISGSGRAKEVFIGLSCGTLRIPENELTKSFNADNRLAGDFAQVYFPSRISDTNYYTKESGDPFGRPSRYAPLVHLLFKHTLCQLDYGWASWWHIVIQVLIFYISIVYFFIVFRRPSLIPFTLLFCNAIIFATPTGMSFIERGQFSLYVALAYLWLFMAIYRKSYFFFFISAFFSFIKWTSLPFVFVILMVWLSTDLILNRGNQERFKYYLLLVLSFAFCFGLFMLVDLNNFTAFFAGITTQESNFSPKGLSLALVFGRGLSKLLPLFLFLLSLIFVVRKKIDFFEGSLLWFTFALILITFPTKAFDYSTPCLLGVFPLLLVNKKVSSNCQFYKNKVGSFVSEYLYSEFAILVTIFILIVLSMFDYLAHKLAIEIIFPCAWLYIVSFVILNFGFYFSRSNQDCDLIRK